MNELVTLITKSVQKSKLAFCKFISANDCGKTGGHQSGFYIPKNSIELAFDSPGIKGSNKEKFVQIKWQNDFTTNSRFIYYGTGTRNEYRLTRFGKGFPFLTDDNVGDLLILCHIEKDQYEAFVLDNDDDIELFFTEFNISPNQTNRLIEKKLTVSAEDNLLKCFFDFNAIINKEFPSTFELSSRARDCYNSSFNVSTKSIISNPDQIILKWLDSEYQLFKLIEIGVYSETIKTPFKTVEELIDLANTILNRRKSRAGKSLEYHLAEVFNSFGIKYTAQAITEDNKKPDFIFPGSMEYHSDIYDKDKLVFLAAKTTCKDRWRQVVTEADRIDIKHLFTLQQGISKNQLKEMYNHGVRLVVPKEYKRSFPDEYKDKILSLESFISYASSKQGIIY